jgi:hypothetical protein
MTLAGTSIGLTISGSLSFPATNLIVSYTGTTTFDATTTGKTITTNGVAFGGNVTLNGVGGAWTLGSAFSCGTDTLTITRGTFDTSVSNYAVTAARVLCSSLLTRSVILNGSTITLSIQGLTVWNFSTTTGLTFNSGSSTIVCTANNFTFEGGGLIYNNLSFTNTSIFNSPKTITGSNVFNDVTISGPSAVGENTIEFSSSQIINGTLTINGSQGNRRLLLISNATGTARTLTCATIASMTDVSFRDITIAGAHGTLSGTRLGDCGGNSNITFVAGTNKYWNLAAGGNWTATAWATGSSSGSPATTNHPLPQDTAIIENTGLNTGATITINGAQSIGSLDMSGRTNAMTFTNATNLNVYFYGNFTFGSGVTPAGSSTYNFSNRSTKTLNSGGKTFTQGIAIDAPNGGIQLLTNNLTITPTTTLTRGELNLNNLTLSTGVFSSGNSNTRSIAFGSTGGITLTSTSVGATVLAMATATNFTFTGTSNISAAMSVTRTFSFGGTAGATASNRLNINLTSGSSAPTFIGSFRQINFTGSTFNAGSQTISCHGFTLASGGTYTSTSFTTVGTGTLTHTGKSIFTLLINTSDITTTLADAGQNGTLTLTNGTLDLAGFTMTCTTRGQTATGTKNLTFNGGTLVISGANTTAWNNAAPTGFTTTAGTGTGTISMTSASAKTFVGGGSTYNCTLNQGGAGTLTITGANTFNDITETVPTANQITFPASITTTVNAFTLSGSSGNLVSIRSSTPATRFTLSKSSGTVSVSFLDIQDSNATGGATWEAFTSNGNVNSGNNLGWVFAGGAILVYITESSIASDSISTVLSRFGVISELATASDSISTVLSRVGSVSETATANDSIASILTAVGAVSETAAASDSIASVLTAIGAVSETSTISETTNSTLVGVGNIAETSTIADSSVGNVVAPAALLESATISDANASILTAVAAVSESSTLTDATTSSLVAVGQASESATVSDSVSGNAVFPNALSESATASDSIVGNATLLVSSDESSTVSDSPQSVLRRVGSVSESAVVSDQASSQLTAVGVVSEQVSGADADTVSLIRVGNIREGLFFYQDTGSLPTGTAFTGSPVFNNTSAGGGLTVVANGTGTGSSGGFNAGKNYVLFTGANTRSIRTISLNLVDCRSISFSLIRGTSSNGGETPDAGENIVVEYSINGGAGYSTITTITNTAAPTTFTRLSYSLPLAAQTSATIIRWRQVTSTAGTFDNYGIRDFYFGGVFASDSIASRLVRVGAVSETSTAVDSIIARLIRVGLISEASTASDAVVTVLRRIGLISETSTASDSIAAGLQRVGAVSETSTVSDSAAAALQGLGAVSESATVSDSVASFVTFLCTLIEQAQVSESVSAQLTAVAAILEQARGADQVLGALSFMAQTAEGAAILDQALIRFYWELIEDNQLPNWQNASNTQTPSWTEINTSTTPSWQNVSNNQASSWTTIDTSVDGNWNNINTRPE